MRRLLVLALTAAASIPAAAARAGGSEDCEKKAPPEAERVFEKVAGAFRRRDAAGVTSQVAGTRDARLFLGLSGLEAGSYTREQATELLSATYFPGRTIVKLEQADGCTTGDDVTLSRTYLLTTQVGRKTVEGTLTVQVVRRKVDDQAGWFLASLKDA